MHYYRYHIGDYRRDTGHLTLLEHGIYRQLLDLYYLEEKPLDANALRLICARTAEEKESAQNILNEFFDLRDDGKYYHERCEKEMGRIYEKSEKARASAELRWNKDKNANALPTDSERNADGMLPSNPVTHNPVPNKKLTPLATLMAMSIPEELASEYLSIKKTKRSAFTKTAANNIKAHAEKNGMTFLEAIEICVKEGWVGFNVGWTRSTDDVIKKTQVNTIHEKRSNTAQQMFGDLANGNNQSRIIDISPADYTESHRALIPENGKLVR